MFIGRTDELAFLEKEWQRKDFRFIVVYGRRRVGKSMLLTHFAEEKRGVYHLAQETSPKSALEQFSQSIASSTGKAGMYYKDWNTALDDIAELAKSEQLLLIIDEFPYLAESDSSLLSLLQNLIDTKLRYTSLFLVLCGSTIGFMERKVLGAKSPLFGRRTGQMKIEPFDYFSAAQFVPEYTNIDKALTFSVFGGIPHYLAKLDSSRPLAENILENVLDKNSYLYDEPALLLKQELREPSIYNAIIMAIATGASRLNEIATKVGEDVSKCGKYLSTLCELGFVLRETPLGTKASGRKTLYSISDPFFMFWYSFVFPHRSSIERGLAEYVLNDEILPQFNQYAGRLFERICIDFLHRLNSQKRLPFVFRELGRWWGTDRHTRSQIELDIVARGREEFLFGECKWTKEPVSMREINKLISKSDALPAEKKSYAFFSKSGYSQAVYPEAQKSNTLLFTIDDMYADLLSPTPKPHP